MLPALHVQTRRKTNIPLDQLLRPLHLLIQRRIPDQSCRRLHLPTRLIQPRDHPDNRPLHHIRQIRYPVERETRCPFVDHLYQAGSDCRAL